MLRVPLISAAVLLLDIFPGCAAPRVYTAGPRDSTCDFSTGTQ